MPSYKYSAIGSDGRTVTGRLDAPNKTECVAELRKLSEDKDPEVAQEGLRALRAVQSRL